MPDKSAAGDALEKLRELEEEPFSPAGFAVFKGRVGQYVSDLANEAGAIAKRERGDVISASHVEKAANNLIAISQGRVAKHVGTLGGILLGAAVSQLLTYAAGTPLTVSGVVIAGVMGMVGAAGVTFHAARE